MVSGEGGNDFLIQFLRRFIVTIRWDFNCIMCYSGENCGGVAPRENPPSWWRNYVAAVSVLDRVGIESVVGLEEAIDGISN